MFPLWLQGLPSPSFSVSAAFSRLTWNNPSWGWSDFFGGTTWWQQKMGNTKIYTPWHWNGWIPNWLIFWEVRFFLPRKASNTCGISMVRGVNSKGEIAIGNEFMFWSCLAWANQNTRFHVRKGRMFLRWNFLYQPLHITSTYGRVKVKVVLSELSWVIGANPKAIQNQVLRHSPSGRSKSVERQFTIQLRWIEITGCFHGS